MNADLKQIKNYIFDLDGTLIDSSNEVLLCFKKAFEKAGIQVDENKFTSNVIGPPLREILKLLSPELDDENKVNKVISYFRSFYDYDENDITEVYSGISDVLKYLKQKDFKIFIATLKPMIPTLRLIKKFNLEQFFDDIYTIDKYGNNITKKEMIEDIIEKYGLKKSQTVMIGDAKGDIKSAKEVQIYTIGALWGYGDDKSYLLNNADINLKTPAEIIGNEVYK